MSFTVVKVLKLFYSLQISIVSEHQIHVEKLEPMRIHKCQNHLKVSHFFKPYIIYLP